MAALLAFSRFIDAVNLLMGRLAGLLVLLAVITSAGNAVMRKAFNLGSNALLEAQWYMFSAVFLLGAGYVLLKNAHVRIDFIAGRLSKRTNAKIDIAGILIFIIPLTVMMISLSWPLFHERFVSGEVSENAGGLVRWPAWALLPLGFSLLGLQLLSELIKRWAFLTGHLDEPFTLDQHDPTAHAPEPGLAPHEEGLALAGATAAAPAAAKGPAQ